MKMLPAATRYRRRRIEARVARRRRDSAFLARKVSPRCTPPSSTSPVASCVAEPIGTAVGFGRHW
jgi:hypothetical protein